MRITQLWIYSRLASKLNLLWERITFSRITTFFFMFSIAHCCIQVVFQTQAFLINEQAASLLYTIILKGNATESGFPVLGSDLRNCPDVPDQISTSSCQVIWSPGHNTTNSSVPTPAANRVVMSSLSLSLPTATSATSSSTSASTSLSSKVAHATLAPSVTTHVADVLPIQTITVITVSIDPTDSEDNSPDGDKHFKRNDIDKFDSLNLNLGGNIIMVTETAGGVNVTVSGLGNNASQAITLDETCLKTLNWPVSVLLNTKREDITFIAFQVWVLGMSIVALLNESIPHIIASLLTHLLATAWGGFQISSTAAFRVSFARLTTNGACHGHNLLPDYWQDRGNAEIPSLALNVVSLLVSMFLTWRLVKSFGWQTFKRVGASLTINRIYKAVLTLSITIQLSLFFMVATVSLWLDQLWNGSIAHLASLSTLYKVTFSITLVLLVPWLMTGWFAVRREAKKPMLVFLALCVLYMGGWSSMFAAATFRWTFVQWRFFSVIASASVLLTVIAFGLGLICRINFGKGLPRYLNAQEPLPDDHFISPSGNTSDPEKVEFPSHARPIPTFSAAFGSGPEAPLPSQMFAPRQKGPRFYNQNAEPFETPTMAEPQNVHTRSPTDKFASVRFSPNPPHLSRHGSDSSERSFDSISSGESGNQRSRRWVIE